MGLKRAMGCMRTVEIKVQVMLYLRNCFWIENKANIPDQLVSASSPAAGEVQLHEMAMDGNVMKMRQVKDIPIPAGGSVELKPGGYHLMFLNLKGPFVAGQTVPVKLKFAKAGEMELKLPVNAVGSSGAMSH